MKENQNTIYQYLKARVEVDGEKKNLEINGELFSYKEILEQANDWADYLSSIGIKKRDRIVTVLNNCIESIALWFGISRIGALLVPVSYNVKLQKLNLIAYYCDPALFVLSSNRKSIRSIEKKYLKKTFWLEQGANYPFKSKVKLTIRTVQKDSKKEPGKNSLCIIPLFNKESFKGISFSEESYIRAAISLKDNILEIKDQDTAFTMTPIHKLTSQVFILSVLIMAGGKIVINNNSTAENIKQILKKTKIGTLDLNSKKLVNILCDMDKITTELKAIVNVGRKDVPKLDELNKHYTITFIYGFIECMKYNFFRTHNNSFKKLSDNFQVEIVDHNGKLMPCGEIGEIAIQGKESMFSSYYNEIDRTRNAIENGYFRTGKKGYKDDNENYYIFN